MRPFHPLRRFLRPASVCSLIFLTAAVLAGQPAADPAFFSQDGLIRPPAADPATPPQTKRSLASIQIPFVAADARDPRVSYSASTFAGTVFVTRAGKLVYSLPPGKGEPKRGWTITETLVGGKARPTGEGATPTRVSSFIGNDPSRWRTNQPTYDAVALGEVWPGIDVRLRAYAHRTEKLFVVHPGARASRIRMRVAGARALGVNEEGALVATTGLGDVTFSRPVACQEIAGVRREVDVSYAVRGNRYSFRLGAYDPTFPVVIDPVLQATYLGGDAGDAGHAVAIHPTTGEIYVAGSTASPNFPGTAGGAQPFPPTPDLFHPNCFIARFDPDLTILRQATYLGGSGGDSASAIAVHPTSGEVYVTGSTSSQDFPGTVGAFRGGFVARLSASLTTLGGATYLGGTGHVLAVSPSSGDVYVAGVTSAGALPDTTGGAQEDSGGGRTDAFVMRLNAGLTRIDQATYLGGSGDFDEAFALAIHPTSGEIYVAGRTSSSDFPGTAGGAQDTKGSLEGALDAFVARLAGDLTTIEQSTYLGAVPLGGEPFGAAAFALAISPNKVFVAGFTDLRNFPGTSGSAQPEYGGGGDDAFIARLNTDLTVLEQATYLGGNGSDDVDSLAIHATSGELYVAGTTTSTNLPGTLGGAQESAGGARDAFAARLTTSLTTLLQSTYLGGGASEVEGHLAIHPSSGDVYLAGATQSTDFPGTAGGAQATKRAGTDAFVARLTADLTGNEFAFGITGFSPACGQVGEEIVITGKGFLRATSVTVGGVAADFRIDSTIQITATVPAGAATGPEPISVSTPSETAVASSAFTVVGGPPQIAGFSPTAGPFGSQVIITGTNFGCVSAVYFGGNSGAEFHVVSASEITAVVPFTATEGPIRVTTSEGSATSIGLFTVRTVVNHLVELGSLNVIRSSSPVSGGPAGTMTIRAAFHNRSETRIRRPFFVVNQLSGGNLLLNADGGPAGVGAKLSGNVGSEGVLEPDESFTTDFVVGLQSRTTFSFFVAVWGEPIP